MAEQIESTSSTAYNDVEEEITYQELMGWFNGKMTDVQKFDFLLSAAICEFRSVDMMKGFIKDGVCVNIPENPVDKDVASPLHMCVHEDFVEGVSVLVEAGAEVDIRWSSDLSAPTPLHYAMQCDNLRMVEELLSCGADPLRVLGGRMGKPPDRKPFKWDCFYMAKKRIYGDERMRDFFGRYQLFEEDKLKLGHLYWRREPDIPEGMWWPTAVCVKDKIFVCKTVRGYTHHLHVLNVVTRRWSKLRFHESCEMGGNTLATTNNHVHCLGGQMRKDEKEERHSKVVFTLDCDSLQWSDNTLPPLNIGRTFATSTSFEGMIVVAGGWNEDGLLSSVEVLDCSQQSSTWWKICDLPVRSILMQCTVSDTDLYIAIGSGYGTGCTAVYSCNLSAVKEAMVPSDSTSPESFWHVLPEISLRLSGLAVVNNCLVSVGGYDDHNAMVSSSAVHLYDSHEKTWTKVSDLRSSRSHPAVVLCNFENRQYHFVLGGGDAAASTSVESCEVL